MRDRFIGITLLYSNSQNEKEQKSYVLFSYKINDLYEEIETIVSKQLSQNNSILKYKYIGIMDIFLIVGPIKEGAVLGRMPCFGYTKSQGNKLKKRKYIYEEQIVDNNVRNILLKPIYYYKDKEIKLVITFNILMDVCNFEIINEKAIEFCMNKNLIAKMIKYDYSDLNINKIEFLGFEEIIYIKENIFEYGSFESSFEKIEYGEVLEKYILNEEEIYNYFYNEIKKIEND